MKYRHIMFSMIKNSHRGAINDIKFVPKTVKVDKKNPNDNVYAHIATCAEDGMILIWDSRHVSKEKWRQENAKNKDVIWEPFQKIQLYRRDGTGELGLTWILFWKDQTDTFIWCSSDEGDLVMIDWSVKPPGDQKKGLQAKKEDVIIDYILQYYESERNFRPVLELARSPFYEDLLLTVHDFYFCIWKTSLRDYEAPIFRSSYT